MKNQHLIKLFTCFVLLLGGSLAQAQYNYSEVLQKSLYFYEAQQAGALPDWNRVSWRGDAALTDGKDVGLDLTGGWFDAGDHVKFGFPMAFSVTTLNWGYIAFTEGYRKANQENVFKQNIRWVTDYFIKCHTAPNELYAQVSAKNPDHSFWVAPELVDELYTRLSYKIDATHPGTDLACETAAALASASIVFADSDPAYSAKLLAHAKELYTFGDTYRGLYSSSISVAAQYQSDNYVDELIWGAIWLYRATKDEAYLNKAKQEYTNMFSDGYWGFVWADKSYAIHVLMAQLTGESKYKEAAERHLDAWVNGSVPKLTAGGMAHLTTWGSLRHSSNTALLALVYSDKVPTSKATVYHDFALRQIDYALGSNPLKMSYVVGFGNNPPRKYHHRGAHGAWSNDVNTSEPEFNRHVLYGALVGGPGNPDDAFVDDRTNYEENEVACDYNAGFTGAVARLAQEYGGTSLPNFPVAETPTDEFYVEAKINQSGSTHIEYAVWVHNHTAWPARKADLSFRLFVDISEGKAAGYAASDYVVSANGSTATFTELKPWSEVNNIYYTEVTFNAGVVIFPAGKSESMEEAQIRIRLPYEAQASAWDASNDWSAKGLNSGLARTNNIPLYANGELVSGSVPLIGNPVPATSIVLNKNVLSLEKGGSEELRVKALPTEATVNGYSWTSIDANVVSVDAQGKVRAIGEGKTYVVVNLVNTALKDSCEVTVYAPEEPAPATSIRIDQSTIVIGKDESRQLTAKVLPEGAFLEGFSWVSSNETIVAVDGQGKILALNEGVAVIRVLGVNTNLVDSCTVTVVIPDQPAEKFIVKAIQNIGGRISPEGNQEVYRGESFSYTITADAGYQFDSLLIDGVGISKVLNYSFDDIAADHSIEARFSKVDTGGEPLPNGDFGTPLSTPLPSVHKSYNYVHVLGSDAKILENMTAFVVNWDLANTGLWQFSVNTNDGSPDWYVDLRTTMAYDFTHSSPWVTFIETGFPNLDGTYYVNFLGDDFVLVSQTGDFTIYFSNSPVPPINSTDPVDPVDPVDPKEEDKPKFEIWASAAGNGVLSPSGTVQVSEGDSAVFTLQASSGAKIGEVKVDGLVVAITNRYVFRNVTQKHELEVRFEKVETGGGEPLPSGDFGMPLMTALPTGHQTYSQVHVLGSEANILENMTVFVINWDLANKGLWQFSVNTNNGKPDWYVDLRSAMSYDFEHAKPTVTFSGSGFEGLDGTYYVNFYEGDFVMTSVEKGYTLYFSNSLTPPITTTTPDEEEKEKEVVSFIISASATEGGEISRAGIVKVVEDETISFRATPYTGYRLVEILVDGESVTTQSVHTFLKVKGNHDVRAVFAPIYEIRAGASSYGRIMPEGTHLLELGSTIRFTVEAEQGYKLKEFIVDGISVVDSAAYTFSSVNANHFIHAIFEEKIRFYQVDASATVGGSIMPTGVQVVQEGEPLTFIAEPNEGYRLQHFLVDGVKRSSLGELSLSEVSANFVVEAVFVLESDFVEENPRPFCDYFALPFSSLKTVQATYNRAYVLGDKNVGLDNMKDFTINWDYENKGLWQLSMNTFNGFPSWYVNLRDYSKTNFMSSEPTIEISNTGIEGLDGTFFVKQVDGNIVFLCTTENYCIVFTNSYYEPTCANAVVNYVNKTVMEQELTRNRATVVHAFPSPFVNKLTIELPLDDVTKKISITNQFGRVVYETFPDTKEPVLEVDLDVEEGIFIITLVGDKGVRTGKVLKNR